MILTDEEIRAIQAQHPTENDPMPFAHAIKSAVIAKLAQGVSVEPDRWVPHPTDEYALESCYSQDQLNTAIAQARVQALSEAAKVCSSRQRTVKSDHPGICYASTDPASIEAGRCTDAIRALIGETP